jgi:hypothetical protein
MMRKLSIAAIAALAIGGVSTYNYENSTQEEKSTCGLNQLGLAFGLAVDDGWEMFPGSGHKLNKDEKFYKELGNTALKVITVCTINQNVQFTYGLIKLKIKSIKKEYTNSTKSTPPPVQVTPVTYNETSELSGNSQPEIDTDVDTDTTLYFYDFDNDSSTYTLQIGGRNSKKKCTVEYQMYLKEVTKTTCITDAYAATTEYCTSLDKNGDCASTRDIIWFAEHN